jgi:gamma-glutamyltranspeptidase / glutathione hydrolase
VTTLQPSATAYAPSGLVCAVDHLASQAGVDMLRRGGSAADAAVATSAVLAVTSQHMCGMGGDLFAVVVPPGGPPQALNASGRAGSGADPDRLRGEGARVMPFKDDIRAVTVPGCVDGWVALHDRFGRLPLADVLEPARHYAADGFPASPTLAMAVPLIAALPHATDFRGPIEAGTTIRRPGLARALGEIAADGRKAFYEGEFGDGLLAVGAGEFDAGDLARSQADWVQPATTRAWGVDLWTVPPNSQGYLTLAAAWLAERLPLPDDPDDPTWAHLLIEACRQASFDRLEVLHEHADATALLDPERLGARLAGIDPVIAGGAPGRFGDGDTIALCAVDSDRMGVCVVQSNASGFGAHLIVPGVDVFLHNRGYGFSLEPGHPCEYRPGMRPAHTLSPTAVTEPGGALRAVVGTMGGDAQPQILVQVLARWLVAGQEPGDAVAAGRWVLAGGATGFDTWRPDSEVHVRVEANAPDGWVPELARRGHRTERTRPFSHDFGHAHLIAVAGDHLAGGTDPRPRFGAAAGY